MLWSKKAPNKQYLGMGSSGRTHRERLLEYRRDIMNGKVVKAVPKNLNDTRINEEDIVFVLFKIIRISNRHVLLHKAINEYNMIEAGVNRILA